MIDGVITFLPQMREYRVSMNTDSDAASARPVSPAQPRAFMTLAARYGLPDMEISNEDEGPQSVEDEFSTYIATISNKKMDPLAFWGVSNRGQ